MIGIRIRTSAPGRCGIVGNPTDMYGGSVISCSTRERAFCEIERCEVLTLQNGELIKQINTAADLEMHDDNVDIARAALRYFKIDPSQHTFKLSLSTEIPMRAGLAGSTAMLAAIVGALYKYLEKPVNLYELAETTRRIEAHEMHIVCGLQDQHMAVFGGINFMNFAGKEMLEQRADEPLATIEPLADRISMPSLLLAHTGVQHHSGTVHKSPRQRWLDGDATVRESYAKIATLAVQGKRAIVQGDIKLLGELMNENHAIVANLGGSGESNEKLIAAARQGGALGAKLAGAGGGGTIICLHPDTNYLAKYLLDAGADSIMIPQPANGFVSENL